MIIDFHTHLYPPAFRKLGMVPPSMFDVEELLRRMDDAQVDLAVVHSPQILIGPGVPSLNALEHIKTYNEFAAELNVRHQGRLLAFGVANPFGGDADLRETEEALTKKGLSGIAINSNVGGEYLDSSKARAFFRLVAQHEVPVFVHPPGLSVGAELMGDYRLMESLGRPFDTALSIARALITGLLHEIPNLTLVAAHMGGALISCVTRIDTGWRLRSDPTFGPWGPEHINRSPLEYFRMLYVDSMGFNPWALRAVIEFFGADHVVVGSDFPPIDFPLTRTLDTVRHLEIPEVDKQSILGKNARRLLKL
ncbi:MAG: amidohydrolase [Acidobacteria bacterium]|nr:amidohydrolase [Acidobacteriota bacterium]